MVAIKWLTASNFGKESIRGICLLMLESNDSTVEGMLHVHFCPFDSNMQ